MGTVTYSDYPPAAQAIPRVGDNKALDLERIAALKPDLIVVWRHGNAERQTDARALHIPLFFSEPKHLDDVASSLRRLGTLLGTQPAADAAAAAYTRDIAALRTRYSARAPVTMFFQVWDRPLMTLNGAHLINDVIELCGGRNVFGSLAARADRHRRGRARGESGGDRDDECGYDAPTNRCRAGALAHVARTDGRGTQQPVRDRRRSADTAVAAIAQGAAALCEDLDARARRTAR